MRTNHQTEIQSLRGGGIAAPAPLPKYDMGVPKSLSLQESKALRDCERTIERGLKTFEEVGEALCRIRDGLLYRQTHGTFEQYCQDRWQIGARRARQLAAGAEVVRNLKEIEAPAKSELSDEDLREALRVWHEYKEGDKKAYEITALGIAFLNTLPDTLKGGHQTGERNHGSAENPFDNLPMPKSERQTRALAALPKEEQQEVWKEAVRTAPGGQVTGKHVEEVIRQRKEPELAIEIPPLRHGPEVEKLAKQLYSIATAAGAIDGKPYQWRTAADSTRKGMVAIACWHLEQIRNVSPERVQELQEREEKRNAKASPQKQTKETKLSGYVIYRPPIGHGHVKQRYSTRSGWAVDPRKATIFADGKEARRKAFAKGERVMTLAGAIKAFERK